MPVTELALLRLRSPTTISTPSLRDKLAHARTAMQDFTNRKFYYLQQIEDPSLIYVLGEWDSLAQHMGEYIPSPANQNVLEELKDSLGIEWLIHLDVPQTDLPVPEPGQVVGITRHFVQAGKKEKFADAFERNKKYLQEYVTEGVIEGGWKVEREEGKEEFVLFSPWRDVAQHHGFAETKEFEKYGVIREFLDGAEIKHAVIVDVQALV